MFIGHFALGFAAVRADRRLALGTAFIAAQLPDALWPVFVLAGVERVAIAPGDTAVTPLRFEYYPFSHSLLMVAFWGIAFAGLHFARHRAAKPAILLALLATSHWVLDFVSHRPDLPLMPETSSLLGLSLWQSVPATIATELLLFAIGVAFYASARRVG